ncbi:hypothetical protein [Litorihabitans aurantiacus]|uniref:hypothetical protein n=1 Tax=Litorihabitans aurantiacus TaxID=1930061 RepID=UPI0024E0F775|nr:hypothetical protein [Litorihabitans aurantiacus]
MSAESFHLQTPAGVYFWGWGAITSASIVADDHVEVYGEATSGPVRWVLHTPWAALIFASWALRRHRRHPQLVTGTWLPVGFLEHVVAQGYRQPMSSPVIVLDA